MATAFWLGAAIAAAGLAALAANGAAAHGPFTSANPVSVFVNSVTRSYEPTYSVVYPQAKAEAPHKRQHARITLIAGLTESRPSVGGSQPVCVRLCDGYFFPLPTSASNVGAQTEACNSLCPDAPTDVYYRNGAERIEDAISARGQRYSALPVSLRYRTTTDNTCSCHRDAVAYAPLGDSTLKQGDAVMTPAGFMVFRGAEGAKHGAKDFAALSAAGLPTSQRGALQAIERASVAANAPTLKDWLIAQAAPWPKAAERTLAHASNGDDKIRLVVWRGAQD